MPQLHRVLTHKQILLRELAQHGGITYAELLRRWPDHDRRGFAAAVLKLSRQGIVRGPLRNGGPIEATGDCPCCGREL